MACGVECSIWVQFMEAREGQEWEQSHLVHCSGLLPATIPSYYCHYSNQIIGNIHLLGQWRNTSWEINLFLKTQVLWGFFLFYSTDPLSLCICVCLYFSDFSVWAFTNHPIQLSPISQHANWENQHQCVDMRKYGRLCCSSLKINGVDGELSFPIWMTSCPKELK